MIRAVLLGFGTVGSGVYRALQTHGGRIERILGERVAVTGVLVKNRRKPRNVAEDVFVSDRFSDLLAAARPDVIFEATGSLTPIKRYLLEALSQRIPVISANKELIAREGEDLLQAARENGVKFGIDATVAGGVPVVRTLQELIRVNRVKKVTGILNGTSNYILSLMHEQSFSLPEAVREAQIRGYAESDPTKDLNGDDAFYKGSILSTLIFGQKPYSTAVVKKGIEQLTENEVDKARKEGKKIKPIVVVEKKNTTVAITVGPRAIGPNDALFFVDGVDNAVQIETDLVGGLLLKGPGAGAEPTASAMIEDFVHLFHDSKRPVVSR